MKLNKRQKQILLSIGAKESDFRQIEECASLTRYDMFTKENESITHRISRKKAIEILGEKKFLASLCRATFHRSSVNYNDDYSIYVVFDSSKYWKEFIL